LIYIKQDEEYSSLSIAFNIRYKICCKIQSVKLLGVKKYGIGAAIKSFIAILSRDDFTFF